MSTRPDQFSKLPLALRKHYTQAKEKSKIKRITRNARHSLLHNEEGWSPTLDYLIRIDRGGGETALDGWYKKGGKWTRLTAYDVPEVPEHQWDFEDEQEEAAVDLGLEPGIEVDID